MDMSDIMSDDILNSRSSLEDLEDYDMDEDENVQVIHMDIREPLSTLRHLLEQKLNINLKDYNFTLQETQYLEASKNLVDQCVQGEGYVQINVKIKDDQECKTIDIVDVLKPPEEYIEVDHKDKDVLDSPIDDDDDELSHSYDEGPIRWVSDPEYRKDQIKFNIPFDPEEWDVPHVRHWILWAVRHFSLTNIKLKDWFITGKELCSLTREQFNLKVPVDPDELFWMHFMVLKKCKLVAVKRMQIKEEVDSDTSSHSINDSHESLSTSFPAEMDDKTGLLNSSDACIDTSYSKSGFILSSSNKREGHIHLWQFLLELLTDIQHRHAIRWVGSDGEFYMAKPHTVAKLWGLRKNKPAMNYEKLSRALRYYYDGEVISKVPGKRFVYKFVCDLKFLIGYSPGELNALLIEAEKKDQQESFL